MMKKIYGTLLVILLITAPTPHAAAQTSQSDHIRCQTKGYIKKSLRYQRCLQELVEYKKCREGNQKKIDPYNGNHKQYCSKQSQTRFPLHLSQDNKKTFSITYENEPEQSYNITIQDKAQYTDKELKTIKEEFVMLCIKERQKQRASILKTLTDCESKLRVAR